MKQTMLIFLIVGFFTGCGNNRSNQSVETGTVEATEIVVSSLVTGNVTNVFVEEGSLISAGDTIATIDAKDYVLQLRQAEAGAQMAEAQYQLALQGSREEDIKQAEVALRSAENDLKRMKELFSAKTVTEKQLEDAQTRYDLAQQTYDKVKKGLRREEIETARYRRDQATAQSEILKKKIADCVIRAPLSGTVTVRYIEPGELAGPAGAIVKIADLKKMTVTVYVSVLNLPKINVGDKASLTVDGLPDRKFMGTIIFISPTAEFTPKNIQTKDERTKLVFAVKLSIDNTDNTLKIGLPADVTLDLRARQ
jgi:HlyD family secretion protein